MKKVRYGLVLAALCSGSMLFGQGVTDALKYAQQDIRGTARYMGMAGAFGALGGDVTTLGQNPAGIGVYRNSDLAATIDLSNQVSNTQTIGAAIKENKFSVACNNFGFVWTIRTNQEALKNLNIGFSYNKQKSFDRSYKAQFHGLKGGNSLSGYIAQMANGIVENDLAYPETGNYDPYNEQSWLNVLGYQSYLISPYNPGGSSWHGVVDKGNVPNADLYVREKGSIDQYNFNIGGNIYNVFYWGIGLAVTDFSYSMQTRYGEEFTGGTITTPGLSDGWYVMRNQLHTTGSGVKANLGVILRATDNFRLGFAFHTPNYYKMTDIYSASVKYDISDSESSDEPRKEGQADTPDGSYDYEFESPWRMIASAAYVFGHKGILSFDYEYTSKDMSFNDGYDSNMFFETNNDIVSMTKAVHTFKVGAELMATKRLSARLGYAYQTSPVESVYRGGNEMIPTAGTLTTFTLDRATQYFTAGLGYRFSNVYVDLAYMHRYRSSELFPFSPVVGNEGLLVSPQVATLTDHNNSFALTLGVKF